MELDSGAIRIDGLDISRMGVRQLRSKMAIIPQVSSSGVLDLAFILECDVPSSTLM